MMTYTHTQMYNENMAAREIYISESSSRTQVMLIRVLKKCCMQHYSPLRLPLLVLRQYLRELCVCVCVIRKELYYMVCVSVYKREKTSLRARANLNFHACSCVYVCVCVCVPFFFAKVRAVSQFLFACSMLAP